MCEIMYNIFVVLVCISLVGATSTFYEISFTPCGNCTCIASEASADCSNRNLNSVPTYLPANTTDLNLSRNYIRISSLTTAKPCQTYSNLSKLSLAWNGIDTISDVFDECTSLNYLDLTGNVLEFPSPMSFEGLQNLKELTSIEVEELDLETFKYLTELETLNLTIYGIAIQPGVFNTLLSLKKLILTLEKVLALPEHLFSINEGRTLKHLIFKGSKVKDIPNDFLDGLIALKELHLDLPQMLSLKIQKDRKPKHLQVLEISNIRNIAEDILYGLKDLETVKLYGIKNLAGADLFQKAHTVKELEIVRCSLTQIPEGWFHNMRSLETLNLSENVLENINPADFLHLTSLQHLILSNNKINNLSSNFLDSVNETLKQLLLNGNQLKRLEPETFIDLVALEVLDLRKNIIRSIAATSFRNLPHLRILKLSGNYISSLDHVMFEYFPSLKEIDLVENIISKFPENLLASNVMYLFLAANNLQTLPGKKVCGMRYLINLGLEDNPITCDCSVRALHNCRGHLQIQGQCSKPSDLEGQNIDEVIECDESLDLNPVAVHLPSLASPILKQPSASMFASTLSNSISNSSKSASLISTQNQVTPLPSVLIPNLIASIAEPYLPSSFSSHNLLSSSFSSSLNLLSSSSSSSFSSSSNLLSSFSSSPNLLSAPLTPAINLMESASFITAPNPKPSVSLSSAPNLMKSVSLTSFDNLMKSASLTSSSPNLMTSRPASSTTNLIVLELLRQTPSLTLSTSSSTSPSLAVTNQPTKNMAAYFDEDYDTEHDEIVRPLIATEILERQTELAVTSSTERFLTEHTSEMDISTHSLGNISDEEGEMNELDMKENETNSVSPDMVHVPARLSDASFWSEADDIAVAFLISLAVMAVIVAGLWYYRKSYPSGSYNPVSPPRELPPDNAEVVLPVTTQQSIVPLNQKASTMTIDSANLESVHYESAGHESINHESVNHESPNPDPY